MEEKIFCTDRGDIHYYVSDGEKEPVLVFLPGLTADHRLFEKQLEEFGGKYRCLVWDAPGHCNSRPFELGFELADKAKWLHGILETEGISSYVLIGQSMGGYVSQVFMQEFPVEAAGMISIDSAPLQLKYMKKWEIASLKHTRPMYAMMPWKTLKDQGAKGCAETEYGYQNMYEMMAQYEKGEYCDLVSNGYLMLAEAIEKDLPYEITCPCILVCGCNDKAGYTKKYNEAWTREAGLPIRWIVGAGHNSNADKPEEINEIIRDFVRGL